MKQNVAHRAVSGPFPRHWLHRAGASSLDAVNSQADLQHDFTGCLRAALVRPLLVSWSGIAAADRCACLSAVVTAAQLLSVHAGSQVVIVLRKLSCIAICWITAQSLYVCHRKRMSYSSRVDVSAPFRAVLPGASASPTGHLAIPGPKTASHRPPKECSQNALDRSAIAHGTSQGCNESRLSYFREVVRTGCADKHILYLDRREPLVACWHRPSYLPRLLSALHSAALMGLPFHNGPSDHILTESWTAAAGHPITSSQVG
jgi:hypothetical protein